MSSIAEGTAGQAGITSARARREGLREVVGFGLLSACTLLVAIPAGLMIWFVFSRGLPAINWEFLTTMPTSGMKAGGIYPAIMGSAYLVLVTLALALPVGVLGAVFLNEYARQGTAVRLIRLAIVNLAGVPSIVYGLFGMGIFVMVLLPALMRLLGTDVPGNSPACLLAAGATMSLLVLPMVITTTEEALRQVPQHVRSGSLALGATKWQTIWKLVLPNAMPGILTGLVLAVGRAAGETAPILLTGAVFYSSLLPGPTEALFKPFMALPYHVYAITTQLPNAPDSLKWGTVLVLLALVLSFNVVAIALRTHLRKRRRV